MTRCVGAILAGGAASRFGGKPKGLASVGGQRMIDRVASALKNSADEIVLVANAPDAASWLPGIPVARDVLTGRGSLIGIDAALAWAEAPVLVVGWDMPFVSSALLTRLRAEGETANAPAAVEGLRGVEGACAYYTPDCRPVIARLVERGEFRLRALFDAMPKSRRLPISQLAGFGDVERVFFNVNTPGDLARAESLAASR